MLDGAGANEAQVMSWLDLLRFEANNAVRGCQSWICPSSVAHFFISPTDALTRYTTELLLSKYLA